jgi:hypothetical protein
MARRRSPVVLAELVAATSAERRLALILSAVIAAAAVAAAFAGSWVFAAVCVVVAALVGSLRRPSGIVVDADGVSMVWRGWARHRTWNDIDGFEIVVLDDDWPCLFLLLGGGGLWQVEGSRTTGSASSDTELERVTRLRDALVDTSHTHRRRAPSEHAAPIASISDRLAKVPTPCAARVTVAAFYARCVLLVAWAVTIAATLTTPPSRLKTVLLGAALVLFYAIDAVVWIVLRGRCRGAGYLFASDLRSWGAVKSAANVLELDIGPLRFGIAMAVLAGAAMFAYAFGS